MIVDEKALSLFKRLDADPSIPDAYRGDLMRHCALAALGLQEDKDRKDVEGWQEFQALLESAPNTGFSLDNRFYAWVSDGGSWGGSKTKAKFLCPLQAAEWILATGKGTEWVTIHPDYLATPDGRMVDENDNLCARWARELKALAEKALLSEQAEQPSAQAAPKAL